jgi:hypothetical protein
MHETALLASVAGSVISHVCDHEVVVAMDRSIASILIELDVLAEALSTCAIAST